METTEDQEILPLPTEEIIQEAPVEEATQQQTKSVKNFWERLDEVFNLSKQTNQSLEDILEQFPDTAKLNQDFKSFIFQPERISISSNDDPSLLIARSNSLSTSGHAYSERFSTFRINFQKALRNVKSIQLLSAVLPNATQNIPDEAVCFFYYKLRSTSLAFQGEWNSLTSYTPGDIVGIGALNKNYACKTKNINVYPPTTYWTSTTYWLPTTQQAFNAWQGITAYNPGDLVVYLNANYICATANTGIIPGPATLEWNNTQTFYANTKVLYNGITYVCLNDNLAVKPGVEYWKEITLGINPTLPNYYDLNPYHIQVVYLFPTFGLLPEAEPVAKTNGFNRTFQDYTDLVAALNYCVSNNGLLENTNSFAPNEITFQYNATLNKIQMVPDPALTALGYYFMPCGYADPNIPLFLELPLTQSFFGLNYPGVYAPQTTLNLRLGFTWNGVFPDPFISSETLFDPEFSDHILWYLRPANPQFYLPFVQNLLTFNSYPDLVNTSSVRIYADITLGSTEDSSSQAGLLSVVPVNASNLGVSFYQNNFNNPLTKIPQNITEINIRMLTDTGLPYYLPNSATVLLELALEYK